MSATRGGVRVALTRLKLYMVLNRHRLWSIFSVAVAIGMIACAALDVVGEVAHVRQAAWEVMHLDQGALRQLASVVATFDSVGLALVWVTGSNKPAGGGVHLQSELYESSQALARLAVGIVAIGLCVFASYRLVWLTQTAVTWAFGSMLLVLPVLADQIEAMSLVRIANRVARRIREDAFVRYRLAAVAPHGELPFGHVPALTPLRDPTEQETDRDPLLPLHEVVAHFNGQGDRIGGRMALRIILGRIAYRHSRYLSDTWTPDRVYRRGVRRPYAERTRPVPGGDQRTEPREALQWRGRRKRRRRRKRTAATDDLLSAFHVLHYFVMLSETLAATKKTKQGPPDDLWRHMLVDPLIELYEALLPLESARQTRVLIAHSLYRICLAFDDAEPRGRLDPMTRLFRVAKGLWLRGVGEDEKEAQFLIEITAAVKRDTRQLGIVSFPDEMPPELFREWDDARRHPVSAAAMRLETSPWLNPESFRDELAQRRSGLGRPPLRPTARWAGSYEPELGPVGTLSDA